MRKFLVIGLFILVFILSSSLYVASYEVLPDEIEVVTANERFKVGVEKSVMQSKSPYEIEIEFENKNRYDVTIETTNGEAGPEYMVTVTSKLGRHKNFQFELEEPLKQALVIVDIQNQYSAVPFIKEMIEKTNTLIDLAREKEIPVIFVRNTPAKNRGGEFGFALVSDLHYEAGDKLVDKSTGSAFYGTDLKSFLDERQIKRLYLTGLASDQCYSSTGLSALKEGYKVVIVGDAHTNFSSRPKRVIEDINNMFGKNENAEIINTADIDFE